jgi:type VI secretion system protein ImpJ
VKKVPNQTSRVHWQMGQALLPEHFYAQEQSLREEIGLRFRTAPVPSWGLASLQWDTFQLIKGIISVQELTLFLQSGTVIDVPGNTAPAVMNLNATGAALATVYVHLDSAFDVVSTAQGDDAEEGVERVVQRIELSTSPYTDTSAQTFKLADFEAGPDGAWSLVAGYVPPLVRLGTSPFFEAQRERARGIARTVRQTLLSEIQDNYLAAENQSAAKAALRGLYGFMGLLADVDAGVPLPPYELFKALRGLYLDICVFRGINPASAERAYDHEDIAGSFETLLKGIEEQVSIGGQKVPYVEFVRREGMLVCELPVECRRAKDVFMLVQKPQVSSTVDLTRLKVASESRIHTVYERALKGIPLQKMDNPPFFRGISANVDFFAITPGQEWDYAVREGKVVLFDGPPLAGTRLYLYWRTE